MWGWDRKSVPRITDWHLEACRVMTNGDREGQFLYALLIRITDYFSCSPLNTSFYIGTTRKKTSWKPWKRSDATWWSSFNITMTVFTVDVRPACGRRAAVCCLSFPRAGIKRKPRSGVGAKCFSYTMVHVFSSILLNYPLNLRRTSNRTIVPTIVT